MLHEVQHVQIMSLKFVMYVCCLGLYSFNAYLNNCVQLVALVVHNPGCMMKILLLFQGIAKRLVKAALHEAAKKREMRYSDLRKIDKRVRRHFHDDITVIVLYLNYDQISRGHANAPNVSLRSALEH